MPIPPNPKAKKFNFIIMVKKQNEEKSEGNKQVDLAVKEIQEKYGEGSIMKLGDGRRVDVDVIPTGSISLDIALGVGGVPRGRVVELYGPESSGKTTLALHLVAEVQKMGGVVREVGNTVAEKTIVKALAAEGLAPSAAFETFAEDFEAENPSYKQVRKADPAAAARWLASSFSIHVKREGRTPMGNRAEASLERGGGSPARVGSAASQVKINQRDPNKILRLHEAITKGETPVDENGVPYKIVRH